MNRVPYLLKLLVVCLGLASWQPQRASAQTTWTGWQKAVSTSYGDVYLNIQYNRCTSSGVVGWPKVGIQHTFPTTASVSVRLEGVNCEEKSSQSVFYASDRPPREQYIGSGNYHLFKRVDRVVRTDISFRNASGKTTRIVVENGSMVRCDNCGGNQTGSRSSNSPAVGGTPSAFTPMKMQKRSVVAEAPDNTSRRDMGWKQEKEADIERRISQVGNPQDRQHLTNELDRLRGRRDDRTQTDYQQLLQATEAVRAAESTLNGQYDRFISTYAGMSQEFQEREEPLRRKAEYEAIRQDNTLTTAQKLQKIEAVNEQLSHNKSVLEDDARRIQAASTEINAMRQRNAERATAGAAALGTGVTALAASLDKATDSDRNLYRNASLGLSLQIGLESLNIPIQTEYTKKTESNNGRGAYYTTIRTESGSRIRTASAVGLVGRVGLSPFFSNVFSLGAYAQYSLLPLDLFSTIVALGSSDAGSTSTGATVTTNYSTASSEQETVAFLTVLEYGIKGNLGGKNVKLLYELGQQRYSGTYLHSEVFQFTGTNGLTSFQNTYEDWKASPEISNTRLLAGIRIGSYNDDDESTCWDILAGKDIIRSPSQTNSPFLIGFGFWKRNRFEGRSLIGPGYFNGQKTYVFVQFRRSFDWFWPFRKR